MRWIVDDAFKFVQREIRRGSHYDAIIMDPPKFGRGPGGEVWKFENNIDELIANCVLSPKPETRYFSLSQPIMWISTPTSI